MPREILTQWRTDAGNEFLTVMYFLTATDVNAQRSALAAFWAAADNVCAGTTTWEIATEGRELSTPTGALEGAWSDTAPFSGSGGGAGDQSGDALQALVRWDTGSIVNGRFLRGRNNIPGLASTVIVDGNLSAAGITIVQNAAAALVSAAVQLAVWHRPINGAGGIAQAAVSSGVWEELAVLRGRRG